jgi:hypothetical protein
LRNGQAIAGARRLQIGNDKVDVAIGHQKD